ncbi:carcinoembryonic antigen-related cell adhesion molecule 1-like isoform X2 [Dendropsophus ebraccatus]|uniref:carcinoembryonic antigen-related cell adhesion molecule 1-like isoform X2 n=1 Tax=Dendropsophus ebraccatus TaxID=150705 RepID=UPI0038313EAD
METSMFLFILLLVTSTASVNAEIKKHTVYQEVGSSMTFPPVDISKSTVYDLKREGQGLLFAYHGSGNMLEPYTLRAKFYSTNGIIVLNNLTKNDSGTYQQVVDMKVVAEIELYVIGPLKEPTLQKVNETKHGDQYVILLECRVQGEDPFNVTFLKDGEVFTENITRMGNNSYLSLDGCDPGSSGRYTCRVSTPLGNKTSSEVKVSTQDKDCRSSTSHLGSGTIALIFFVAFIVPLVTVGFCFVVYTCLKANGKAESANTSNETSELELSRNETPSETERGREGYQEVPTNDSEGSRDSVTVSLDPSPEEDIRGPDPSHCGEDGTSTMEVDVDGTDQDHSPVANG